MNDLIPLHSTPFYPPDGEVKKPFSQLKKLTLAEKNYMKE
jgi:hypothetical protein